MTYAGDLDAEQAWALLEADSRATLVDVRTEAEWVFVGLPDLTSLGRKPVTVSWNLWPAGDRNEHFLEELRDAGATGDGPVLFLCRSGARSAAAAAAATEAGLGPCYNITEGFEGDVDDAGHRGTSGWKARGLPWRQS